MKDLHNDMYVCHDFLITYNTHYKQTVFYTNLISWCASNIWLITTINMEISLQLKIIQINVLFVNALLFSGVLVSIYV